jgi:DNA-binding response OmpR family regulator
MARILMVNDEIDLLTLCQSLLSDLGHDVAILTSGNEALEQARRGHPDLIIVDWVMPDTDGSSVLARLKGHPATKDTPVLAISALPDGATRAELAGADRFLAKPFDVDELVGAVNHVLHRRAHPRRDSYREAASED